MDEKVRYPIERSPFYPHSFIIFFVFRFISLPQYFSFARFLYSYLYGVAHNYAHRKEIKKKKDGTRQLFLRPSHHTERKWRRISPPHAMAITGCK